MLAEAAVLGIPVGRLIRTTNGVERDFLIAIHKEAIKVMDDLHTKLARKIVKEYGDAQTRGKDG
jgi:hypothetical protein